MLIDIGDRALEFSMKRGETIVFRALLYKMEAESMTPQGEAPLARDYKHDVQFEIGGIKFIARGAWVKQPLLWPAKLDLVSCELSVDKVDVVEVRAVSGG